MGSLKDWDVGFFFDDDRTHEKIVEKKLERIKEDLPKKESKMERVKKNKEKQAKKIIEKAKKKLTKKKYNEIMGLGYAQIKHAAQDCLKELTGGEPVNLDLNNENHQLWKELQETQNFSEKERTLSKKIQSLKNKKRALEKIRRFYDDSIEGLYQEHARNQGHEEVYEEINDIIWSYKEIFPKEKRHVKKLLAKNQKVFDSRDQRKKSKRHDDLEKSFDNKMLNPFKKIEDIDDAIEVLELRKKENAKGQFHGSTSPLIIGLKKRGAITPSGKLFKEKDYPLVGELTVGLDDSEVLGRKKTGVSLEHVSFTPSNGLKLALRYVQKVGSFDPKKNNEELKKIKALHKKVKKTNMTYQELKKHIRKKYGEDSIENKIVKDLRIRGGVSLIERELEMRKGRNKKWRSMKKLEKEMASNTFKTVVEALDTEEKKRTGFEFLHEETPLKNLAVYVPKQRINKIKDYLGHEHVYSLEALKKLNILQLHLNKKRDRGDVKLFTNKLDGEFAIKKLKQKREMLTRKMK